MELQPPVKFHDVVPIFQNPRHFFIRDALSLYDAPACGVACFTYKWYLGYDSEKDHGPS